ncbi:hypothetical protein LTR93_012057 [Exophiala xenobiotica]|nr:hypothetical protein LTR93_012057 [Exophiala xenobiotica]
MPASGFGKVATNTVRQKVLIDEHDSFSLEKLIISSFFGFILLAFPIIYRLTHARTLKAFPVAGPDLKNDKERKDLYFKNPKTFLAENYYRFKGQIFRVISVEPYLIVPPKYIDEIKSSIVDNTEAVVAGMDEKNAAKYSTIYSDNQERNNIIKSKLMTHLGKLGPDVADELEFAFETELPPAKDWTNITIFPVLLQVVARMASRTFVGPELCRNEEWLRMSTSYTLTSFNAMKAIRKYPAWLRPIMAYFTPEVIEVQKLVRDAQTFFTPIVRAREEQKRMNPNYQKPNDMIQWAYDNMSPKQAANPLFLGHEQLVIAFASFHTTTSVLVQTLYDLVARPEYIEPLRLEIRHVLSEHDGQLTNSAMEQLKKMDSFMKESQRFSPNDYVLVRRYVQRDIKLSDGALIPAGTLIKFPTTAMHFDPENISDPEKFDGFRFSKTRDAAGVQGAGHQFAGVAKSSMNFGYGKHACPGRFFAAMEIKMILVALLLRYDIRIVGEGGKRYPNLVTETAIQPDPTRKIGIKRIADQ